MKTHRKTIWTIALVFLLALALTACGSSGEAPAAEVQGEAQADVAAQTQEPVQADAQAETQTEAQAENAPEADSSPSDEVAADTDEAGEMASDAETSAEADAPAQAEAAGEGQAAAQAGGVQIFRIDPERTQARFTIDEVLMGSPKTVVGVTSLVEGEIQIDPAALENTQISTIRVDASDLTTDDNRRNRAIRERILSANNEAYRYITFEPTAIVGLPASVAVGESVQFQVTGNLTIRDTTREETFDVTVTPTSETEITGLATTVIRYADYGLAIPSVPFVANVSEEVQLELEFTAVATGS